MEVTFANRSSGRFDLVIGANGIHSRVRALAFDGGESTYVAPPGGWTAYFTLPCRIDGGGWFLIHNARGGRVALLGDADYSRHR